MVLFPRSLTHFEYERVTVPSHVRLIGGATYGRKIVDRTQIPTAVRQLLAWTESSALCAIRNACVIDLTVVSKISCVWATGGPKIKPSGVQI